MAVERRLSCRKLVPSSVQPDSIVIFADIEFEFSLSSITSSHKFPSSLNMQVQDQRARSTRTDLKRCLMGSLIYSDDHELPSSQRDTFFRLYEVLVHAVPISTIIKLCSKLTSEYYIYMQQEIVACNSESNEDAVGAGADTDTLLMEPTKSITASLETGPAGGRCRPRLLSLFLCLRPSLLLRQPPPLTLLLVRGFGGLAAPLRPPSIFIPATSDTPKP